MQQNRILAIDDERVHSGAHVIARTYSEGMKLLVNCGPWSELLLDHDLGAVCLEKDDNGNEMTGYKIACFLEEFPSLAPATITVVTANGPGLRNIAAALDRIMDRKGPRTWTRR